jgi:hypothetical protein
MTKRLACCSKYLWFQHSSNSYLVPLYQSTEYLLATRAKQEPHLFHSFTTLWFLGTTNCPFGADHLAGQ